MSATLKQDWAPTLQGQASGSFENAGLDGSLGVGPSGALAVEALQLG